MRAAALALAVGLAGCARPELAPIQPTSADAESGVVARFRDARALAVDGAGRLYIVDAGLGAVVVLLGGGLPAVRIGGPGTGVGAFLAPADVDPTNGQALFVADAGAGAVLRFTGEARVAETVEVPEVDPTRPSRATASGARGQPVAVAAGPGGTLYVAEAGRGVVLRFDAGRRVDRVLGGPTDGPAALVEPVGLAVAADGTVYVADAGRDVVQVFDPFGAPLRAIPGAGVGEVVAVSLAGRRLLVVGPRAVAFVDRAGGLDRVVPLDTAEPAVDAALVDGDLLVLTRTRLVRLALSAAGGE